MESRKVIMIAAALAAILVMSVLTIGFDNHVRWNNNLQECVYFYAISENASGHCYVAAEHCPLDGKDHLLTIDPVECSDTPLNRQPATPASCVEFQEGDKIVLTYSGNDPDEDVGPAGRLTYKVDPPFDENNVWQTKRGDAGEYHVNVQVSDGDLSAATEVCFSIMAGNAPPTLRVVDVTVDEGELVRLAPECDDPDGDAVRLSYSGDLNGSTWQTSFADAGRYSVTVTCEDMQGGVATETVNVIINDLNRKPVLSGPTDYVVQETETLALRLRCSDPEGEAVSFTVSGDLNQTTWRTGYEDAGDYSATVTCRDASGLETVEEVNVRVENKNRPPRITAMVALG